MKQIQKGFTLIELMIVVAIIGILAAVAIPAYQDYVVKAKLAKVASSVDSIKTAIALFYQENGEFPAATTQVNVTGQGVVPVTGALWTSLGISSVNIPPEVKQIGYLGNTGGSNYGMSLVFQNIKATSINDQAVLMTPVLASARVSVTGGITLNASGIDAGATSLPTFFVCSAGMDTIARKYFNNSGVACPDAP